MGSYKKYNKEDQKLMAAWALDCAERVLPLFVVVCPNDNRPQKAIQAGRDWIKTGNFAMAVIRKASLGAHSAARDINENEAACFSARAAGQAVATAHVAQHAYGASYYALKAIVVANPNNAKKMVDDELKWQTKILPKHLRKEIMSRIIIDDKKTKIKISIDKSDGF